MKGKEIRLTYGVEDSVAAAEEWGFNCGPAALCAVLGFNPSEIRPYMGDFEQKGYTNAELMAETLDRLGMHHWSVYRGDEPAPLPRMAHGLVRVQWAGAWTKRGVPMVERQRKTHWIAVRHGSSEVFDINALCVGGWVTYNEWQQAVVPWLCEQIVPGWNGCWWPTHAYEVRIPGLNWWPESKA